MILLNIPPTVYFLFDTLTNCIIAYSTEGRSPLIREAERLAELYSFKTERYSILENGNIR